MAYKLGFPENQFIIRRSQQKKRHKTVEPIKPSLHKLNRVDFKTQEQYNQYLKSYYIGKTVSTKRTYNKPAFAPLVWVYKKKGTRWLGEIISDHPYKWTVFFPHDESIRHLQAKSMVIIRPLEKNPIVPMVSLYQAYLNSKSNEALS